MEDLVVVVETPAVLQVEQEIHHLQVLLKAKMVGQEIIQEELVVAVVLR
tara:strand:- start:287 stop:433 length:147 start_codon:yes stop_codon:yes gene_type:complete